METPKNKPSSPQRNRARKSDGKYQGSEAGNNQAFEPTDMTEAVKEAEVKYTVRQMVDGTSNPTAGKYQKKNPKVRPTFGNVTSISH